LVQGAKYKLMPSRFMRGQKASKLVLRIDDIGTFDVVIKEVGAMINISKTLKTAAKDIAPELEHLYLKPLIKKLSTYPPRKLGMKIRWKSRKQQRKVMMILRRQMEERGDNEIWYHRTGYYKKAWAHETVFSTGKKGVIRVRVYNKAQKRDDNGGGMKPLGTFIQGRVGLGESRRSMERYRKPMQPFHVDRGWVFAQPLIAEAYKKMQDHALNSWYNKYEIILSRVR